MALHARMGSLQCTTANSCAAGVSQATSLRAALRPCAALVNDRQCRRTGHRIHGRPGETRFPEPPEVSTASTFFWALFSGPGTIVLTFCYFGVSLKVAAPDHSGSPRIRRPEIMIHYEYFIKVIKNNTRRTIANMTNSIDGLMMIHHDHEIHLHNCGIKSITWTMHVIINMTMSRDGFSPRLSAFII